MARVYLLGIPVRMRPSRSEEVGDSVDKPPYLDWAEVLTSELGKIGLHTSVFGKKTKTLTFALAPFFLRLAEIYLI